MHWLYCQQHRSRQWRHINDCGVNVGSEGLIINGGTFGGSGVATFGGAITLNANADISNNGGTFTLNSTIDGAHDLIFSGSGSTILNNPLGTGTALTNVTATSNLTIGGGAITTSGDQAYQNVATTNNTIFTSNGTGSRSIVFNGAITGGNDVTYPVVMQVVIRLPLEA